MIELIVWILREVFGSQEPPARVGPRSGSGGGAYGQSEGSGQPPKTLAELLEEARAELDGGSPRPAKPHPRPAPPPPEPPRSQAPPVARPAAPRRVNVPASRSTIPPPVVAPPMVRTVQAQPSQMAPVAMPQAATKQKPKKTKAKAVALTSALPVAPPATSIGKPSIQARQRLEPWIKAMRSQNENSRRQAALIALVGGVVLGPPKCRQRRRVV